MNIAAKSPNQYASPLDNPYDGQIQLRSNREMLVSWDPESRYIGFLGQNLRQETGLLWVVKIYYDKWRAYLFVLTAIKCIHNTIRCPNSYQQSWIWIVIIILLCNDSIKTRDSFMIFYFEFLHSIKISTFQLPHNQLIPKPTNNKIWIEIVDNF